MQSGQCYNDASLAGPPAGSFFLESRFTKIASDIYAKGNTICSRELDFSTSSFPCW